MMRIPSWMICLRTSHQSQRQYRELRALGSSRLREHMERCPADPLWPMLLAGVLEDEGRSDEALAVQAAQIEREGPARSTLIRQFRAGHLRRLGRYEEALAEYQALVEVGPAGPSVYLELGDFHARLGDRRAARECWREAIRAGRELRIEPTWMRPWYRTPAYLARWRLFCTRRPR